MSKANSRKTKLKNSSTKEQLDAPFRYDLHKPEVYNAVAYLANQLNASDISIVAAELVDFSMTMADQGQVGWAVRRKPTSAYLRLLFQWERADCSPRDVKLDMERKERRRKLDALARKHTAFVFHWGRERHARIKFKAGAYGCTIGMMVTLLLEYGLDEYNAGRMEIELELMEPWDRCAG